MKAREVNLKYIFLIFSFLGFIGVTFSSSGVRPEVVNFEVQIENRVNTILKSFDPNAFVVISMEPKIQKPGQLPGTPYSVNNLTIGDLDGSFELSSSSVVIVGKNKEKLEAAIPIVKGLLARFGSEPQISIQTPELYDYKKEAELSNSSNPRNQSFDKLAGGVDKLVSGIVSLADFFKSNFWLSFGIFASVAIFFVVGFLKLGTSFLLGMKSLAAAIEAGGLASQSSSKTEVAAATEKEKLKDAANAEFSKKVTDFSEYSDETLLACLSDCYWGEFDSYALFIWRRAPLAKRNVLAEKASVVAPQLVEYFSYISESNQVSESDLKLIDDPSYIKPLEIYHLNNSVITSLVRNDRGLVSILPALRIKKLEFSLVERIKLRGQSKPIGKVFLPEFSSYEKSVYRSLDRMSLEVNSVEDESELMAVENPDTELYKKIPTLIWSMQLTDEDLTVILQKFSARDLALAWIGPELVLERLAKCIAPKKLELIQSNLKKISPSRRNPSFFALTESLASKLREKTQATPSMSQKVSADDSSKKAA